MRHAPSSQPNPSHSIPSNLQPTVQECLYLNIACCTPHQPSSHITLDTVLTSCQCSSQSLLTAWLSVFHCGSLLIKPLN